ncbi:hypothetical protein [Pseudarthrobacter raffinosi]|uniref:hypothetical protein n=1 Tax=Pseudarthrobacter raffinosi TaxID=2953651 RepID=UPI00208F6ABA|nr:hypothetical protein [Pseudarthrobacter sp. MDT3-9]MCO4252156.1 hypothetical protein [Pseudarthrobacter sp. MDT3-9]
MSRQSQIVSDVRARPPGMYRQWSFFKPGDRVEIWAENLFLFSARVDDRTDDGEVLWVIEERTGMRRLFLRSDGVTLYPA